MKILHLLADYKWTGPAEPILDLCLELRRRGHTVHFACQPSDHPAMLPARARERGLEPVLDFRLSKKLRVVSNIRDIATIRRFIDDQGIEIVHCHSSTDHALGGLAARRSRRKPLVVRTDHQIRRLPPLLRAFTDGLIVFSRRLPADDRTFVVDPGMDLSRYQPNGDARADLGLSPDHFVVGMVLRIQKHRKFELVLEAARLARPRIPNLRILVLGRGTHRETIAIRPAREMGLHDIFVFAGYVREGYLEALNAFDVMLFTVPGSDGTCRALREAMALGKPAIVSNVGLLPELVEPSCGRIVPLSAEALAQSIVWMSRHPQQRLDMGRRAREIAHARFSLPRHADQIEAVYRTLLARRAPPL